MSFNLARTLAAGVGSWLQFEFQCHRSHLFSERYLSAPVGQILSAHFGTKVYAETVHPDLAAVMIGRGRRPEIDFAVLDPYPDYKVAIETKWVASASKRLVTDILWDMMRLEWIASRGAIAVFLLAGRQREITDLFQSDHFCGVGPDARELLSTIKATSWTTRLDSPPSYRLPLVRDAMRGTNGLSVAARIRSFRAIPHPNPCNANQYQVFAWEIRSANDRVVFDPKTHKLYRSLWQSPAKNVNGISTDSNGPAVNDD